MNSTAAASSPPIRASLSACSARAATAADGAPAAVLDALPDGCACALCPAVLSPGLLSPGRVYSYSNMMK
jgi:hypothetical protein